MHELEMEAWHVPQSIIVSASDLNCDRASIVYPLGHWCCARDHGWVELGSVAGVFSHRSLA